MNKQEINKLEKKLKKILQEKLKPAKIPTRSATRKKTVPPVILGLSGGPDSVFLLHILVKSDIPVIAAHLNHNLRGKESTQDCVFVQKSCEKFEIPLEIKSLKIKALSRKRKTNLEETARKERYEFFEDLYKKHRALAILTAHNADDNTETILLNLIRGASLQGLSGMRIFQKHLFRPLLFITKTEIKDFLDTQKIPYRTESSNSDTRLNRNFIRLEIVPLLKKINPSLHKTIATNALLLAETNDFLENEAKKILKEISISPQKISAPRFRALDPVMQKIILRKIFPNKKNLENRHLEEITSLIEKNIGNKEKRLKTITVKLKSNIIHLEKKHKNKENKN